jgi:hypothetical protein
MPFVPPVIKQTFPFNSIYFILPKTIDYLQMVRYGIARILNAYA